VWACDLGDPAVLEFSVAPVRAGELRRHGAALVLEGAGHWLTDERPDELAVTRTSPDWYRPCGWQQ
jgi:hypothetical protein